MLLVTFVTLIIVKLGTSQQPDEQSDDYDDIHELMKHLVKMYENPSISTQSQLRDAAVIYLNKLISLETAVKAGTPDAIRLVGEIYKEGTYKQLSTAPFSMLIGHYGWNELECAELESVTFKANDIWRYFINDLMQVKETSLPTEPRIFVW